MHLVSVLMKKKLYGRMERRQQAICYMEPAPKSSTNINN
jgi:hypothetical protein